jgi:methylenetetrahydrofolate reductase (NADPH)
MAVTTLRQRGAGNRRRPRSRRRTTRQTVGRWLAAPQYELVPVHGAIEQAHLLPPGGTATVTSSPTRGGEATIDLAEQIAALGLRAVPHLAARQIRDEAHLAEICTRLERAGITDVFVIGGDAAEPAGDLPDGLALLQALDRLGHRFASVGIPGYPEGHHTIDDETLWSALKAKAPYATYVVTQLCFDADTIVRFVTQLRGQGITLPVMAGVPGAVDVSKLLRISLRVGVGDSLRFVRNNASAARRLLRLVGYRPDGLVRKLAARVAECSAPEIAGLHIYTFNQVGATVGWVNRAGPSAGASGSADDISGSAAPGPSAAAAARGGV